MMRAGDPNLLIKTAHNARNIFAAEVGPTALGRYFWGLLLCDLGLGYPELGYVSLAEIMEVRGRLGLPVERDLHFVADKPLSAYAEEARIKGRIAA